MLAAMVERLEAGSGHIEINFPYFVNKTAPVPGVQSLMNHGRTWRTARGSLVGVRVCTADQ